MRIICGATGAGDLSCSDERFGGAIVLVDVVADGHDQLFDIMEDATAESILSWIAKEALGQELGQAESPCCVLATFPHAVSSKIPSSSDLFVVQLLTNS